MRRGNGPCARVGLGSSTRVDGGAVRPRDLGCARLAAPARRAGQPHRAAPGGPAPAHRCALRGDPRPRRRRVVGLSLVAGSAAAGRCHVHGEGAGAHRDRERQEAQPPRGHVSSISRSALRRRQGCVERDRDEPRAGRNLALDVGHHARVPAEGRLADRRPVHGDVRQTRLHARRSPRRELVHLSGTSLRADAGQRGVLPGPGRSRPEEGGDRAELQPSGRRRRAGEAHRAQARRPVGRRPGRGAADHEVHDQLRQARAERLHPFGGTADPSGEHDADGHRPQGRGGGARWQGRRLRADADDHHPRALQPAGQHRRARRRQRRRR